MREPLPGIMGDPDESEERILDAMELAILEAAERHRAAGVPMVVYRDGRVMDIPPDQLPRLADRFPEYAESDLETVPAPTSNKLIEPNHE